MPNRIESEQNAKTKSYKIIANYITNEATELNTTAELPASDDESYVKMQCKHANAKDQRNIQERTILQKGCKTQHKRSKTATTPLQIQPGTRPNPWTPKTKREPNSRGAFGKKNVVFHGKINNKIGGAVASICLMIKKGNTDSKCAKIGFVG